MNKNCALLVISAFIIPLTQAFANECESRWEKVLDNVSKTQANFIKEDQFGKCDEELKDVLSIQTAENHQPLRYNEATKLMYKKLDVVDGTLCSVYNSRQCNTVNEAKHFRINCEHTWPKSLGASGYPAVSDLHHLYPSEKDVNNLRANMPFCEVQSIEWQDKESKMGLANGTDTCFEPPLAHKGNVARSMFYFAIRYHHKIDADQEKVLRKWHQIDPVDAREIERNNGIENAQGNRNPFVDTPQLVDLIENF